MRKNLTILAVTGLAFFANAQIHIATNKLPDDFLNFFIGNWAGNGEFANGKEISATVSFQISLDSCWLMYEHADKLPNRYKALSMWSVDAQGQFIAYAFDNFHGHRKFVSEGWKDGKLVLTTNEFNPQRGVLFQHFIYEKLTENTFKMVYETSKDGITWKLGDSLTFTKI